MGRGVRGGQATGTGVPTGGHARHADRVRRGVWGRTTDTAAVRGPALDPRRTATPPHREPGGPRDPAAVLRPDPSRHPDAHQPAHHDAHQDAHRYRRDDQPEPAVPALLGGRIAPLPDDEMPETGGVATEAFAESHTPTYTTRAIPVPAAPAEPSLPGDAAGLGIASEVSADDLSYLLAGASAVPAHVDDGALSAVASRATPPAPVDAVRPSTPASAAVELAPTPSPGRGAPAVTPARGYRVSYTPPSGVRRATPPRVAAQVPAQVTAQVPVSVTPPSIPVLPDLAASRAAARALETLALRVRAGEVPVSGDLPDGDDIASVGAGVAAALAALLRTRR